MANKEETFTSFTADQAARYAVDRGFAYPSEVYDAILNFHNGDRHLLLDVGTRPRSGVGWAHASVTP